MKKPCLLVKLIKPANLTKSIKDLGCDFYKVMYIREEINSNSNIKYYENLGWKVQTKKLLEVRK